METPLAEIIDRYTILKLKMEAIDDYLSPDQVIKEKPSLAKELAFYGQAIEDFRQKGVEIKDVWITELYEINAKCREMESNVRRYMNKTSTLSRDEFEEIGKSAAMLPKFNKQRIAIKNEIAKKHKISSRRIKVPLSEIIDRYTILKLKTERMGDLTPDQVINERPFLEKEFESYNKAIDEFRRKGIKVEKKWIEKLYQNNAKAWDMESAIRHHKEKDLGFEEFGRRALKLRELNKERIAIKNEITKKSKTGFKEIKVFLK